MEVDIDVIKRICKEGKQWEGNKRKKMKEVGGSFMLDLVVVSNGTPIPSYNIVFCDETLTLQCQ